MNTKKRKVKSAIKGKDYLIEPESKRSIFLKNNQAALLHGGFSQRIPEALMDSIIDSDLGFEVGILKGQLCNIATIGMTTISDLSEKGDNAMALTVLLSCADRSSKLVPQIQKAIEHYNANETQLNESQLKSKNRWLKKLHSGNCLPSEVAFQFEIHQLGGLPSYVDKMLALELTDQKQVIRDEIYTKEELQQKVSEYWKNTKNEEVHRTEREEAITIVKQKIHEQLVSPQVNALTSDL